MTMAANTPHLVFSAVYPRVSMTILLVRYVGGIKGQQAMIVVKVAVMDSMTEQRALARNSKVLEERVNKASIVLQYATRRHLSKGQQPMILVKAAVLETNNLTQQYIGDENGIKRNRIAYASMVLQYAPELVDKVNGLTK